MMNPTSAKSRNNQIKHPCRASGRQNQPDEIEQHSVLGLTTDSPTGLQESAQSYLQQEGRGNGESWDRAGIWSGISGMVPGIPPECQKTSVELS